MTNLCLTGAGAAAGDISSPLGLSPTFWARPDSGVYTGGSRTLVAGDKSSFQIADASETGLDVGTSDVSIAGWIYCASVSGTEVIVFNGGNTTAIAGYEVYRNGTSLRCAVSGSSTVLDVTIGTVASGQWYFFAVNCDRDGNAIGYLNTIAGTPVSIAALSGSWNNTLDFRIGCGYNSGDAYWFGGSIADIAIWTRVLTVAEITFLYNSGNGRTYAECGVAGTAGSDLLTSLVSYWNCNEQDATAGLIDQAGSLDLTRTASELLASGSTGFETRTGITGASFAAGDKAHLEIADNAALDLGTGDFVINLNDLITSTGLKIMCGKYQNGSNYWQLYLTGGDYVSFIAVIGGTTIVELTASTTALSSTTTKYHVQVVVDRSNVANCKIYVNGTSQSFSTATVLDDTTNLDNSGAFCVGTNSTGDFGWNGRIAMLGIGKPSITDAASLTAVTDALGRVAGTSGLGQYYGEQSSADKTALAWSAFWDLTEASGNRTDKVSSLVLAEVLTTNLVTNGTFDTDTGWTKGTGWTIDAGDSNVASSDGSQTADSNLYQSAGLTAGRTYNTSFVVSSLSAGTIKILLDGGASGTVRTADGTYAQTITASGGDGRVYMKANADFVGNVDNVTVTAASIPCSSDADVFGGWTEATAGSSKIEIETMTNDAGTLSARFSIDASESSCNLTQTVLTAGNSYLWSLRSKISNESGSNEAYDPVNSSGRLSLTTAWATYTGTSTASSTTFLLSRYAAASKTLYFDTVSCKSAAVAVGNGPAECCATDSVGTAHGLFSGVSAAGLITNWLARGADYAFLFDGTDDTCVCGNLGNVTRISFDVKSLVANQELMTLANSTATAITVVAGTLTFGASLTASNITVDGVAKTAAQAGALINDGTWHTVAFDLTSIAASNVKLATDSSAFGNVALDNVSFLLSGAATHTYTFSDGPWGIPSDGDPVWMVESREGFRYQLSQTTAGNRPVQRVAAINSKPALEFDGASDYLRVASVVPFAAAATIACVVQPDDAVLGTPATQAIIAVQDEGSANNFIWLGISTDGKATIQGNNAATAFTVTGNTVLSDATAYILIAQWDGANWQLSVNGTAQTETRTGTEVAPASISGMDSITLGARYSNATASAWYDGKLAEPVVDTAYSVSQINTLLRHWKKRYGIT